jgi:hypothetical protein
MLGGEQPHDVRAEQARRTDNKYAHTSSRDRFAVFAALHIA